MFSFILSVDPCASSPCKNGGVCHKSAQMYVCKCPKEYQGRNCEKKRKASELSLYSLKLSVIFMKSNSTGL